MRGYSVGCLLLLVVLCVAPASMAQRQPTDEGTVTVGDLRLMDLADEVERLRRQLGAVESRQAAFRIETGVVSLPYAATTRPVARSGSGNRVDRGVVDGRVNFREMFVEVPEVHIGLNHMDVLASANTRIRIGVTAVDEKGFDYEFYSWSDTHVYGATALWIAVAGR